MKKPLLTIITLLFSVNVYAAGECSSFQIQQGLKDLKNVTFSLEYNGNYMDRNGDFREGYFKVAVSNLPEGYMLVIPVDDGSHVLTKNTKASLKGGVYKFEYYLTSCNTLLKSYEVKIPFYKQYCDLDKDCDENVWFDGTYENVASNHEPEEPKTSTALIVVLIILILIIISAIYILIRKRRQKNEINF